MSPDEQEALSVAYAFGVRVYQLTSGNYAHFDGTAVYAILPAVSVETIREIQTLQLSRYEEENRRRLLPRVKKTGVELLKELGL